MAQKQQRRQSVAFKQYEEILKTITKPNNKSPLPVKDRRVGARMKKYRQCFLGRDLIKSLVDQQVSTPEEAMHIATELLHSKLIFPTAKTDDSSGAKTFSRKHYYSISEDIAITATKNQRAMIKVRSQLRNLEEMLLEMKEGFSEVDTTRSADMVAINNYVKAQAKYNRALLWALAGMIVGMTSPRANVVDLDVFGLKQYTSVGIGEWIPSIGWGITTFLVLMLVHWMTKSHKKELSVLSRKLGVGAISKLAMASKRGSIHGEQLQQDMKDINDEQFMKVAMEMHAKLQKQMEAASIDVTTGCLTNTNIVPLFYEYPGQEGDETNCWTESPGEMFKVRGPNYLQDGVKIKSRDCAFKLLHVEFFAVDEGVKVENIAGRSDSFAGKLRKEAVEQGKEPPFLLVICFNFPGYAFAGYFQRRRDEKMKDPAFDSLFQKFIENGDDFRDERFKILPGIPPGGANFLVRKTVGNKPAICGRAVEQQWFNDEHYLEANMDVSGSYMATKILGVVKGFTKGLTIDLTFIIQGNDFTELPERILCGIRIHKPDLKNMPRWGVEGPKSSDGE